MMSFNHIDKGDFYCASDPGDLFSFPLDQSTFDAISWIGQNLMPLPIPCEVRFLVYFPKFLEIQP